MKNYAKLALPLVALGSTSSCYSESKSGNVDTSRPNVILIMCDDLGWGDVGFNGNTIIQTPNLDQWSQEGVKFNRFYSASAVSSPTRASVLTGRNPFRTGVFIANKGILREEEVTIPELLLEEGYSTGHFGKWHLGTLTHTEKDGKRGKPGNTKEYNPPACHGYEEAFVTEIAVPTWDPSRRPVGGDSGKGWNAIKEGEPSEPYGTSYWDIDGNKVTDNLEGNDSRVIMDRVIPFIEKSVSQNKPFLATVWLHAPHKPVIAGPEYAKRYSQYNENFQNYAGAITAMDEEVGRLRKFLADNNLDENTMIWFCSDNGPENAEEGKGGVTGGFRDRKRSLHEGGVRVPAFMVWPAVVKKPFETNIPAVTSDYLPTIVSTLGIDKEKCTNILDGIDLNPIIRQKQDKRNSPIVFCIKGQVSYVDDNYKVYRNGKGVVEYYDIVNDPYENSPLAGDSDFSKQIDILVNTVNSYKDSFEGDEYGTASYDKLNQTWEKDSSISKMKFE